MFKRRNVYFILIVYVLLVALYFLPVLKTTLFCHQDRFVLYGWDIVDSFYQSKSLIKKALGNGLIPWWNPFIHNGISLFGVCADSLFYPTILLYYFLPLISSFTVSVILHIILAGFGMFLLARAFKLSLEASFMTGIIFMFGGFFYSKICAGHLPHMYTAVWLPYIFYAFEKARCAISNKNSFMAVLLGSIFIALAILAGHFQFLYMEIVALAFYMLFILIWGWLDDGRINFKPLNVFVLMILCGICLAAVHFIPAVVDLNLANRSFFFKGEDTSWPGVSGLPFPPKDVITMLIPHFLNKVHYEDAAYLGILPLFFSFGLLGQLSRLDLNTKRKVIFFFLLALMGLFFSFGNQFPFFAIQYYFSPLRAIRVPARYLFLWHFGITLLAGFGLDSLIKNIDSTTKKRLGIFTLFLGGLFWLLVVSTKAYRTNNDLLCTQYLPLTMIGIGTIIYLGLTTLSRHKKIFLLLCIFLIVTDLFIYRYSGLRILDYRGQRVFTYSDINKVIKAPEIVKMQEVINKDDGHRFYRISYEPFPIRNYGFYPLMWQDVFLYDGPETSFLARTYEVQKSALDSLGSYSPIYDLFGVKYVWSEKKLDKSNFSLFAVASSSSEFSGLPISHINDNNVDSEWASQDEMTPWVKLSWSSNQIINKVILYDRTNLVDKIDNSYLKFSDGTTINVGSLPNDGSKKEIDFPDKTVTWIQFIVTSGSGQNVGLREFEVYYDYDLASSARTVPPASKYRRLTEHVYLNMKALPRAFVVHKAVVLKDKEEILKQINRLDFGPSEVVVLGEGEPLDIKGPFRDEVFITKYDFNEVKLKTKTDKDGILILADAYHPGWRAWVDGKRIEIFPVDWAVRGVYLPSGEHEIKFYFFPWYYKIGIGISLASILLLVIAFIKLRYR